MARALSDRELASEADCVAEVQAGLGINMADAQSVIQAAVVGRECGRDHESIRRWIRDRLIPNTVFIDREGYFAMCIAALRTVPSTVATDFGSSRQRDLGQIWGDKTRGYLGELALKIFLLEKYAVEVDLAHEEGELEEFLASDIAKVRTDGEWREPDLRIGVKTTKMNGIWLDIPNNQFNHSDVHVAVKLAVPTNHLFSFMKSVGVFRNNILDLGIKKGHVDEAEANRIDDLIPDLERIPAYVCGVADAREPFASLPYEGHMGTKNFTIDGWNGPRQSGDLETIRLKEKAAKAGFERIGSFSHDAGYLFNTGSLRWGVTIWSDLVQAL